MKLETLYNFISQYKYAVLSSLSANNEPQSALVGIAADRKLRIVFDTLKTTRKYKNLIRNSSISFVIGWDSERTLQYEGIVRIPDENQMEEIKKLYFNVFPDGLEREKLPDIVYFIVEPKWIRFSDYSLPEPKIEEMNF